MYFFMGKHIEKGSQKGPKREPKWLQNPTENHSKKQYKKKGWKIRKMGPEGRVRSIPRRRDPPQTPPRGLRPQASRLLSRKRSFRYLGDDTSYYDIRYYDTSYLRTTLVVCGRGVKVAPLRVLRGFPRTTRRFFKDFWPSKNTCEKWVRKGSSNGANVY